MTMMPSQAAYSIVKASEGRHYAVYFDGAGHATTGVGHKLKAEEYEPGQTFTDADIDDWLDADMEEAAYIVRKHIKVPLSQGQFDALTSFAFQFGEDKFSRYTITKMINQEADQDDIQWQWMKYLYTIDDRDRDGDQDAVIDRGLPIRRLREWLLWKGFSWTIAEAAANANNVNFTESRIPWGVGGFKEVIDNIVDLVIETIERARSLAAFMDEPDDYLFPEEPKPMPKPAPEKTKAAKPVSARPEKTEDQVTADLNNAQLAKLQGKAVPMTQITKKVPVEAVEYLEEVDKTPGNITVKRIEDSERGRGFAKTEQGKQQIIVGAGGSAAVAIGAAEPVVKFVDKYSVNTIAIVFLGLTVLGIVTYYWGKYQREKGEDKAEDLLG